MSSDPPRWLNLPLPRDIRKLIGTYLNPLDRMMVRHAHGAKFTCEYVAGANYDTARKRYQCRATCCIGRNVCIHTAICARRHASMSKYCDSLDGYTQSRPRAGMCDWEWFKILCARYNAAELFAYVVTAHHELAESHSCCRNIYATAIAYGQLEFLEALTYKASLASSCVPTSTSSSSAHPHTVHIPFHTDTGIGFCWESISVLDYVSVCTSVEVYKHLRGRGAIVTHRAYDRAIASGNTQLAAEIERDYTTCTCGRPSLGYSHCGNAKCKHIRDGCYRGGNFASVPWSEGTYQEIFRAGNIAAADTLWRKFAPSAYNICESICDCQYHPKQYTPDNIRKAVDWLLAHYELDALSLRGLYMYAAGVMAPYDSDDTEYQRFREPDIQLIGYLIKQKIPVCEYVIEHVATDRIEVYRAIRNHVQINVNFAIGAISNNMDVYRECMRDFGLPVSKELLTALWREDEYEEFAKLLLQFPQADRVVDAIRGH